MSTSMRRRAPGRRKRGRGREKYHHGDLRRALVEAALDLVRRRGPEGFTLREAARSVGVSQAAPYRHFVTKEALLAAVAEEGFRDLNRRLEEATSRLGPDPRTRLREQGLLCFEFYVADPARFRVMFGPASAQRDRYPALAEAWQRVHAILVESLVACQRAGQLCEGDPMELGLATAAMTHGLAALAIDGHLGPATPGDRAALADLFHRAGAVLYRGLHP